MQTLYTIGYEGIDLPRFMELLRENGVETVIDVRELPLSRKPGFSKKGFAEALEHEGFGYVHMQRLGCPKPIRARYKKDGDWERYKREFLKYLSIQKDEIKEVVELAREASCALMCFEADHNHCHRSMVAAAAARQARDMPVSHISLSGQYELK